MDESFEEFCLEHSAMITSMQFICLKTWSDKQLVSNAKYILEGESMLFHNTEEFDSSIIVQQGSGTRYLLAVLILCCYFSEKSKNLSSLHLDTVKEISGRIIFQSEFSFLLLLCHKNICFSNVDKSEK